ncbi:MFS transporter [Aquimarina brevivitae]|uniref:MFS transporter n=1 Tax=Aquimarina brevivitae TaxID=323412 RepID=A0A4Q7PGL6_9FLAO|nr:MFS transporter [Aquimarina brevivitae]RZS99673.1 MFS transporter [Aquimarina brevivitae]
MNERHPTNHTNVMSEQKHPLSAYSLSKSRVLEQIGHHGLLMLLFAYMTTDTIQMTSDIAIRVYESTLILILFSGILGGFLGDFFFSNKKCIFFGVHFQAAGAALLAISLSATLYPGLFLLVLGSGLYTPNIIASYGKLYFNNTKIMDAGFTLFYVATILGSFVGVLAIGYITEIFGYQTAFLICSVLILSSITPVIISSKYPDPDIDLTTMMKKKPINGAKVISAMILVGIFWGVYEIAYLPILSINLGLDQLHSIFFFQADWQTLSQIFSILLGVIAAFVWLYIYNRQVIKIIVSFVLAGVALTTLFFIPESSTSNHLPFYIISALCLSIAQIHIIPIVYSVITKYANPKYLTIMISLIFIPSKVTSVFFEFLNQRFYEAKSIGLIFGISVAAIVSLALLIYWQKSRKLPTSG